MTKTSSSRQAGRHLPPRRPRHRRSRKTKRRIGWRGRTVLAGGLAVLALLGWAAIARAVAPRFNTDQRRFDAIIVLGDPADSDGNPTPVQLSRVTEAVREYERNVAPRLILTGGAAHNRFVEARVMAQIAEAQGIPASAIIEEPSAMNTIQNACYAMRIVRAHGWSSAEVVSSSVQLPRAGLIFSRLPLKWRVHAAPSLRPKSGIRQAGMNVLETLKTAHYLAYSEWAERCQP